MADTIKVLYKQVGKTMQVKTIQNTLAACQELVGGHIECITLIPRCVVLICNEEGRIRGLEANPYMGIELVGDWFICGVCGDQFADVPSKYESIVRSYMTIRKEKAR